MADLGIDPRPGTNQAAIQALRREQQLHEKEARILALRAFILEQEAEIEQKRNGMKGAQVEIDRLGQELKAMRSID